MVYTMKLLTQHTMTTRRKVKEKRIYNTIQQYYGEFALKN